MSKYLLEVGTEELPYKFIPSAIEQLKNGFENFLNSNKVEFDDVKVYATPRRLAVIVSGLEKESKDEVKCQRKLNYRCPPAHTENDCFHIKEILMFH